MKRIIISCPIYTRSGYGQHSRLLVDALMEMPDVDLKIIPTAWGTTPQTIYPKYDSFILREQPPKPDVWIQVTIPSEFNPVGYYNIGITAGTESSVCSPEFVEGCNRMDKIIAVSEFTKSVLINTIIERKEGNQVVDTLKVKTPVDVLHIGVNTDVFNKTVINTKMLDMVEEKFCFIVNGMWTAGQMLEDRKNISGSIRTFLQTFQRKAPKNRPALILKTSGAGFSEVEADQIREKIRLIASSLGTTNLPNIYFINGELSDEEMNALYNHPKVKAMLSLSHAEGYNISLAEFSLTGKPIICSMYGGPLDFLHRDFVSFVPGQMTKIHPSAANKWLIKDSEWFTPNYSYAMQVLNDVFERYDFYLERSRKHPKYTKDNFSFKVMQEKFKTILDNIDSKPIIKLPKLR